MPLGLLEHSKGTIPGFLISGLAKQLPTIIASALDVQENADARLIPQDINVKIIPFAQEDQHNAELEITIWANFFPEREKNLNERRELIAKGVEAYFARGHLGYDLNFSASVWVLLAPGSYGELSIKVGK